MRTVLLSLALLAFPQSEMVTPKVEHSTKEYTQTVDIVKRSCPKGFEGHYVDIQPGFDNEGWGWAGGDYVSGQFGIMPFGMQSGAPAYTICFSKDFMDKIRKNPEMQSPRPLPPHGV